MRLDGQLRVLLELLLDLDDRTQEAVEALLAQHVEQGIVEAAHHHVEAVLLEQTGIRPGSVLADAKPGQLPVGQRAYVGEPPLVPLPNEAHPPAQQPFCQRNMDGQQGTLALLVGGKHPDLHQLAALQLLDRPSLLHRRAGNQPIGTVFRHGQIERESQQSSHGGIGMVQQQVPGPDGLLCRRHAAGKQHDATQPDPDHRAPPPPSIHYNPRLGPLDAGRRRCVSYFVSNLTMVSVRSDSPTRLDVQPEWNKEPRHDAPSDRNQQLAAVR